MNRSDIMSASPTFRLLVAAVALITVTCRYCAQAQLSGLYNGMGSLSFDILKASLEDDKPNYVHSAYSIASSLGMCLVAAHPPTFAAMQNTMGFSSLSSSDIELAFQQSSEELAKVATTPGEEFMLSKANRVYVNSSYSLADSYKAKVNQVFHANAEVVNFYDEPVPVQDKINKFVKLQTNGLIPELLAAPLDTDTLMALVNALYFKGSWMFPMDNATHIKNTFNSHLCLSAAPVKLATTATLRDTISQATQQVTKTAVSSSLGSVLQVGQQASWIQKLGSFNYGWSAQLEATLVELPYKSNSKSTLLQTSMLIILPDDKHKCNFTDWISKTLTWTRVSSALSSMSSQRVNVTMPKFTVESEFKLGDVLKKLGMEDAFSDFANFNGMVAQGNADVKISEVVHKAKIIVDEKGTEAAAATATLMVGVTSAQTKPPPIYDMFVKRSFVSLILLRQFSKDYSQRAVTPLFTTVIRKL